MSPGRAMRALPPCPPRHAARVTPVRWAAHTPARPSLALAHTKGRDVRAAALSDTCPVATLVALTPCAPLPLACHSQAYMVRPSDASRVGVTSGVAALSCALTLLPVDRITLLWRLCTCVLHRPVAPALLQTLWCDMTDDWAVGPRSTAADPHMSAHRSCLPRMSTPCIDAGILGC